MTRRTLRAISVGVLAISAAACIAMAVPAYAQDNDGVCTITMQLPDTVQPGAAFTLQLTEDSDCAKVANPTTFTYGGLMTGRSVEVDDGIRFSHTIGTGNATYQGTAPTGSNYYHVWINGAGVQGAELVSNVMTVTAAAAAPTATPTATGTTPTPEPVASVAAPVVQPAPAVTSTPGTVVGLPAKATRFASCAAVHRFFSGGIARVGITRDLRTKKHTRAITGDVRFSNVAYNRNRKLDTDRDGIICENK